MAGFLKRLFGNAPEPAPQRPLNSDILFVFAGDFTSELTATDYALGIGDGPSLASDLGTPIGLDDVEVVFGTDRIAATRPMLQFNERRSTAGDANALFLLSDRGADPDTLTGDKVRYLGNCSVS